MATKLPLWKMRDWGDGSLEEAKKVFQLQLDRLGVEYFDFYLLHSLHRARYDEAKARGIVDWLWQEKAAGRIRNFGFSFHDNYAGLEHILRDQPWDFCQDPVQLSGHRRAGRGSARQPWLCPDRRTGHPADHYGADQGRHPGGPAGGCGGSPAGTGPQRQHGKLGAALGSQPSECPGGAVRHERRKTAGGQIWPPSRLSSP